MKKEFLPSDAINFTLQYSILVGNEETWKDCVKIVLFG